MRYSSSHHLLCKAFICFQKEAMLTFWAEQTLITRIGAQDTSLGHCPLAHQLHQPRYSSPHRDFNQAIDATLSIDHPISHTTKFPFVRQQPLHLRITSLS